MATELLDQSQLSQLYGQDFYAWARQQAEALREFQATRPNAPIDFAHLIDEVEDLADNRLRAVKSQLRRIVVHYLKLEHSPSAPPRQKWRNSIVDAQNQIQDDITSSMAEALKQALPKLYAGGRRLAAGELIDHNEPEAAASLPESCPYTLDQLLDETWRPTSRHGHVDEPF